MATISAQLTAELEVLAKAVGYTIEEIRSQERSQRLTIARRLIAVHLSQIGITQFEIAELIGRNRSTVAYYLKKHDEDLRFWKRYKDTFAKFCRSAI